MKRIVIAFAVMLFLFGTAPSKSSAKIIVGLSSVNVAFLPVYVTEAKGFFKDEGLDVLLVLFNAGATNLQALIGGDVQIMGSAFVETIGGAPGLQIDEAGQGQTLRNQPFRVVDRFSHPRDLAPFQPR